MKKIIEFFRLRKTKPKWFWEVRIDLAVVGFKEEKAMDGQIILENKLRSSRVSRGQKIPYTDMKHVLKTKRNNK